jgi:hypothetical protein
MVKYIKWEEHQSVILDSLEDIKVHDITFKGALPLKIVTDINEVPVSGCGDSNQENGLA